jgi:hypothetical protein
MSRQDGPQPDASLNYHFLVVLFFFVRTVKPTRTHYIVSVDGGGRQTSPRCGKTYCKKDVAGL